MSRQGLRTPATVVGVIGGLVVVTAVAAPLAQATDDAPQNTTSSLSVRRGPDSLGTGLDLSQVTPRSQQRFAIVGAPQPVHRRGGTTAKAAPAPASASLEADTPTPGFQGPVGSCVTWAVAYSSYGTLMKKDAIPNAPMAPMYLYSQISAANGGRDAGTTAPVALDLAVKEGVAPASAYGSADAANYDWRTLPSAAQKAEAGKYKLSGYQTIPVGSADTKERIKEAVAGGLPVVIGIRVYSDFRNLSASEAKSGAYRPRGGFLGGHEITIIGYDEQKVRIQNSWGTEWGDGGRGALSWDYLLTSGDLMEANAVGKVVYTGTGGGDRPTPTSTTPDPTPTDPQPSPTDPQPTDPQPTTPTSTAPQPTGDVPSHVEVTASNWEQVKQASFSKPVVLDFGAQWCGACQQLKPRIEALNAAAGGKWVLGSVDVDQNRSLPGQYGVSSYPTVVMLWQGKEISGTRFVGAISDAEIQAKIDVALAAAGNDPAPTPTGTDPQPTAPTPTDPSPTYPEPTTPGPTYPEPTNPEPTNPEPTTTVPDDDGDDDGGCPGGGGCQSAYYFYWGGHLYYFDGQRAWLVY